MHPILADWRRLGLYLSAWVPIAIFLTVGLGGSVPWASAAAFFLPLTLVYAFVCLSAWYTTRIFPLQSGAPGPGRFLLTQIAAGAMGGGIWVAIGQAWAGTLESLGATGISALYVEQRPLLFVVGALLFWLAVALHAALLAFEMSKEAERRAVEQHLLAREAELKALRAQVDPHFLFNSLNSISALTTADPAGARRMCLLLADFLRDTLRLASGARIPLADEIALSERFLAIERVRLGSRLAIARETDPMADTCLVPPLLLQPLLENAIVHGVNHLLDNGQVRLASRLESQVLVIDVENRCDPDRPRGQGTGLGLDLLRRRLETEFGARSTVRTTDHGETFSVEVRIPL